MNLLEKLKQLDKEATQGRWDAEYGVSLRTSWAIVSGNNYVLHLDSSENLDLDAESNQVEPNLELIETTRNSLPDIIRLIEAAECLRKFLDDDIGMDKTELTMLRVALEPFLREEGK